MPIPAQLCVAPKHWQHRPGCSQTRQFAPVKFCDSSGRAGGQLLVLQFETPTPRPCKGFRSKDQIHPSTILESAGRLRFHCQ